MSSAFFSTSYDDQLQYSLIHLANYPQYLPFIGTHWDVLPDRVLFVGESHYLPKTSAGKSDSKTWYTRSSVNLTPFDHQHINTRGVILDAEFGKHNKAYLIFYNIKAVVQEVHNMKKSKEPLFQNFAYYNYFQRPAEITGKSINNCAIDNQVAYQTIKVFSETVKPTVVIFVSKRAYLSFWTEKRKSKDSIFNSIAIHHVPHPACAWWYRRNKSDKNRNGKEKFRKIIKDLNLKIDDYRLT
jgi:hypothetical protein